MQRKKTQIYNPLEKLFENIVDSKRMHNYHFEISIKA
jgi:hypothetical protein